LHFVGFFFINNE